MNVVGGGITKAISVEGSDRGRCASKRMRRRSYVGAWARETEVSYKDCPTHVGVEAQLQGTDAPLKEVRRGTESSQAHISLDKEGRQFYRLLAVFTEPARISQYEYGRVYG